MRSTGWHMHMYINQAWPDEGCPALSTAIPLALDDPRVLLARTYPQPKISGEQK